jgi:ribosomal peptide maturation radical SAM protein 1
MNTSNRPSIILVSLPWTSLTEPSLGLGIISACLAKEGIECRVLHLNLFLLEHIRPNTYYALANVFALNDFLFSCVIDPEITIKQRNWLRIKTQELLSFDMIDQKEYGGLDAIVAKLIELRQEIIPNWLNRWADEIAASDATMVGFTCMFDQTIASVAMARLIKQKAPGKLIVLGGYAVRSPTGEAILRSFHEIDVVCTGEGEPVIVPLARASTGELPICEVPSLIYRDASGHLCYSRPAPSVDMNTVPIPNYDDFYTDLQRLEQDQNVVIEVDRLPIENSRGCWWGETKHCVFCGIHDEDMRYRYRDAVKVIENMDFLSGRYNNSSFRFSDYILPHQYYKTLLPELAARGRPYRITSEMKANVNYQQFKMLAAGGFDEVQPGIESFSSAILRKMDKGVTAIQNLHTLMLGKRLGIDVRYNILYGLPNDDEFETSEIVKLIPMLFHLEPPSTCLQIQVTRYAPLQTNPERFEIKPAEYEPSYDLIFSPSFIKTSGFNLNDFCYYFERTFENSPKLNRLYKQIDSLVIQWKTAQSRCKVLLCYEQIGESLHITDSRFTDEPAVTILDELKTRVYLGMLDPINIQSLWSSLADQLSRAEFDEILSWFRVKGLTYQEKDRILALAYKSAPQQMEPSYSLEQSIVYG